MFPKPPKKLMVRILWLQNWGRSYLENLTHPKSADLHARSSLPGHGGLLGNSWEKTLSGLGLWHMSLYLEPWRTPEGIYKAGLLSGFWASWLHGKSLPLMNPGPSLWESSFPLACLVLTKYTKTAGFFFFHLIYPGTQKSPSCTQQRLYGFLPPSALSLSFERCPVEKNWDLPFVFLLEKSFQYSEEAGFPLPNLRGKITQVRIRVSPATQTSRA